MTFGDKQGIHNPKLISDESEVTRIDIYIGFNNQYKVMGQMRARTTLLSFLRNGTMVRPVLCVVYLHFFSSGSAPLVYSSVNIMKMSVR